MLNLHFTTGSSINPIDQPFTTLYPERLRSRSASGGAFWLISSTTLRLSAEVFKLSYGPGYTSYNSHHNWI